MGANETSEATWHGAGDLRAKVRDVFNDPKYGHDPAWLRINTLGMIDRETFWARRWQEAAEEQEVRADEAARELAALRDRVQALADEFDVHPSEFPISCARCDASEALRALLADPTPEADHG